MNIKTNGINKPTSLVKEEFTNELINLCNNSQLPLFVIEYILKDLIQEIHTLSKRQYEVEKQQYEDAVTALQSGETKEEVKTEE